MANKEVEVPGIGLIKLSKKRGNRNMRLSITRTGEVRVSMPTYVPFRAGLEFAKQRTDWINKNKPAKTEPLTDGMKIGKAHRLVFLAANTTKVSVRAKDGKIRVTHPIALNIFTPKVQDAAMRGAITALKQEADRLLPQRLDQLAKKYDFQYNSIATKKLVSRWGSCSQFKDITLNIYLMQLPWNLIDYVIIHELVHTEFLNHGDGFWSKFESISPDAKKLRKELKNFSTIVSPESVD